MRNDYYRTIRNYILYARPNVAEAYSYDCEIEKYRCTRRYIDDIIRTLSNDNPSYTFYAVAIREVK